MYESHWKLRTKPFENDQDTAFFYPSRDHREALIRLLYAIMEAKGCVILAGEAGCGKTFVLNALARELAEKKARVAMIRNPASDPVDLLRQVAVTFGVRNAAATKSELVQGLEQALAYYRDRGVRAVLLVDDADLIAGDRAFEELRLLLNLEQGGRSLLTLVLAGQPGLKQRIADVPGLAQRVSLMCTLPALTEPEASEYVTHRLARVAGKAEIFTERALKDVYRATGGNPRLINHLCDLALLLGACEGRQEIDAKVIAKARHELREIHQ